MALVDYASSSEDECENFTEKRDGKLDDGGGGGGGERKIVGSNASLPSPDRRRRDFMTPSSHRFVSSLPSTQMEKLPDASLLFSSPSFASQQTTVADYLSTVAAAITANESRKRESNGSSLAYPHRKLPRGSLLHSRNIPDTGSGQLIPPQLRGRSNVVTEDISKLFVRKDGENLPERT